MSGKKANGAIALELLAAVILWGANNAAVKYLVKFWPPGWTGSIRMAASGLAVLALLRFTSWLGESAPLNQKMRRDLWWRCSLSLAGYIACYNFALKFSTASHVALYLGMAPIWALMWDHPPAMTWKSAQRYAAAALAFSGVLVLFWPALHSGGSGWLGEALGVVASLLWAGYGRQCREMGTRLSGSEVSAHSMWRAGVLLAPLALYELIARARSDKSMADFSAHGLIPVFTPTIVLVMAYSVVGGGVVAYVLWNNALKHWRTSQVFLFGNLIPITTMGWAWFCLGEPVTRTFTVAMVLIVFGVVLGQTRWEKLLGSRWFPAE